jgi:hypothetical protein
MHASGKISINAPKQNQHKCTLEIIPKLHCPNPKALKETQLTNMRSTKADKCNKVEVNEINV